MTKRREDGDSRMGVQGNEGGAVFAEWVREQGLFLDPDKRGEVKYSEPRVWLARAFRTADTDHVTHHLVMDPAKGKKAEVGVRVLNWII